MPTSTPGPTERKFCGRCKHEQAVREKMWCWVCNRCDHVVEYKPGTLYDLKKQLEAKNAIVKGNESRGDKQECQ